MEAGKWLAVSFAEENREMNCSRDFIEELLSHVRLQLLSQRHRWIPKRAIVSSSSPAIEKVPAPR
jgi:hypothetical protein